VLAGRIQSIMASQSLREEMAQRGRAIIRERYSWDGVCHAYMEMLVGLASGQAHL
jgi:glycosyltransferase involved in cell wall biosynthesis